ncbi:hypothetical protein U1Q18_001810 [Sarracenia purpurea var. burkii]
MSSRRLLLFAVLIVTLFSLNCHAKTGDRHCDSSCGNIPNISYPFRLKSDPENYGYKDYELACDHNRLVLEFQSAKFYVLAINYNNYTIRLVDVGIQRGNCSSLPLCPLTYDNFPYTRQPYSLFDQLSLKPLSQPSIAAILDCEKPVKNPLYNDATSSNCVKKINSSNSSVSPAQKRHSYLLFGSLNVSDVADLCRIEEIVMTTLWLPPNKSEGNISFLDFHDQLAYGFELSWEYYRVENCTSHNYEYGYDGTVICYPCYKFTNSSFSCA